MSTYSTVTSVTGVNSDKFFVEPVPKETLVQQEQRQQKGIANSPTTIGVREGEGRRGGQRERERERERDRERERKRERERERERKREKDGW